MNTFNVENLSFKYKTDVILNEISFTVAKGDFLTILGTNGTGKTTLLKKISENLPDVLWLNADEPDVAAMFDSPSSTLLKAMLAGYKTVVIDEAQRIENIGIKLKLITDQLKDLQLIATGSSAFELANKINEPLTGRKWEYHLYPVSFAEMVSYHGLLEEKRMLPHRLVFGYYPEVINSAGGEKEVLKQLSDSYLYKDILRWEGIKKPDKLLKLLQALSFQIGNQVSFHELGQMTGLDNETVEKYILLLEQTYIIFRIGSLQRNLRNELKKARKIYFYDNGIRNALVSNFATPELRQDTGVLWENFLMSERLKLNHYNGSWVNSYFWRTHAQQEIDYIEEYDGKFYAYEFKWNPSREVVFSKSFTGAYHPEFCKVVSKLNYEEFLLKE